MDKSALVWKISVGSVVAWLLSKWAGSLHPFLAPLTVILCLQPAADQSIRFAMQRVGGTLFGVLLTAVAIQYVKPSVWMLGLLLLVGGAILKALKQNDLMVREAALSILLVFALGRELHYILDRARDTLIGAIVAVALMLLVATLRPEQRT